MLYFMEGKLSTLHQLAQERQTMMLSERNTGMCRIGAREWDSRREWRLRTSNRFIRSDEDNDDSTFEKRLAKKYYDKLFKEYCLGDFSRYKHGQVWVHLKSDQLFFLHECPSYGCNALLIVPHILQ